MAQCNINTLLANAACFANLPPGMWDVIELQLLCEILAAGGTGGGGGGTCGNYSGSTPPNSAIPASGCGFAIDTSNGRIWWYYNGAWN